MVKRILSLALILMLSQPIVVAALPTAQKNLFDMGLNYFDAAADCGTASSITTGGGAGGQPATEADIRKLTPAAFTGPDIKPTGVMLHWTGGSPTQSADSLVAIMRNRNVSVQLYIDGNGNIFQLSEALTTRTSHATIANSKTIGIEIGAGSDGTVASAEREINANITQKNAVIRTVNYLVQTYNIPIKTDIAGFTGILSHHLIEPGKSDVGDNYLRDVVEALKTGGQAVANSSGSCIPISSVGGSDGTPEANKQLGQQLAAERGFTGPEWICLDTVWGGKESSWKYNAINDAEGNNDLDSSGTPGYKELNMPRESISDTEHDAYGIPQALPGGKMASAGSDWRTNPATQIKWGLEYIAGRYQTPCQALAWHQVNGWY